MIPAVMDSNTCSYSPENLLTSVEVPPMSNPMTGLLTLVVTAYPTTPPAGPDSTALEPLKLENNSKIMFGNK